MGGLVQSLHGIVHDRTQSRLPHFSLALADNYMRGKFFVKGARLCILAHSMRGDQMALEATSAALDAAAAATAAATTPPSKGFVIFLGADVAVLTNSSCCSRRTLN